MLSPSMGEGEASPHKVDAVDGTKESEGCLPTIVPPPVPAIRCPIGVLPLPKER